MTFRLGFFIFQTSLWLVQTGDEENMEEQKERWLNRRKRTTRTKTWTIQQSIL
jgi:hypothetical protein